MSDVPSDGRVMKVRGCVFGAWRVLVARGAIAEADRFPADSVTAAELESCYQALADKKPGKGWELPERVADAWVALSEVAITA